MSSISSPPASASFIPPWLWNSAGSGAVAPMWRTAAFVAAVNQPGNIIVAQPLYIPRAAAVTRLGIEVTTPAVGNGRIGLYAAGPSGPGLLVADSGNLNTNAGGFTEGVIAVTLQIGWYWICYNCDGGGSTAAYRSLAAVPASGFAEVLGETNPNASVQANLTIERAFAFAAYPADESAQVYGPNGHAAAKLWVR